MRFKWLVPKQNNGDRTELQISQSKQESARGHSRVIEKDNPSKWGKKPRKLLQKMTFGYPDTEKKGKIGRNLERRAHTLIVLQNWKMGGGGGDMKRGFLKEKKIDTHGKRALGKICGEGRGKNREYCCSRRESRCPQDFKNSKIVPGDRGSIQKISSGNRRKPFPNKETPNDREKRKTI